MNQFNSVAADLFEGSTKEKNKSRYWEKRLESACDSDEELINNNQDRRE